MRKKYLLAVDQGTTSSRCVIFDGQGRVAAKSSREFTQIFPSEGYVEHDPGEILSSQRAAIAEAIGLAGATPADIVAAGITNQRETTVVWDKATGAPVYNAVVWQCRRTAGICAELKERGAAERIFELTGLVLDPYFSATKLRWIL
jgi:glycerol kinase